MLSRICLAVAKAASEFAPTMKVRVPAAAAFTPPDTGASTNWTERPAPEYFVYLTGGFSWIFYFFKSMYFIQHCFLCRPSASTASEDAGIEPRTVDTSALAVRRSSHSATSHPQLGYISSTIRLHLTHQLGYISSTSKFCIFENATNIFTSQIHDNNSLTNFPSRPTHSELNYPILQITLFTACK